MPSLLTYPARPVNGGPFPKAQPKRGDWFYEPKYNGWRALVHTPTGTMFNRHGQQLSIGSEFKVALDRLRGCNMEWLDCEALERRHGIGRGSLIVLDHLPADGLKPSNYAQRRALLELAAAFDKWSLFKELNKPLPDNSVVLTMCYQAEGAPGLWDILQMCNRALGCEFYEGFVAKRADSLYPIQLRSPGAECPFWMKHRWAF